MKTVIFSTRCCLVRNTEGPFGFRTYNSGHVQIGSEDGWEMDLHNRHRGSFGKALATAGICMRFRFLLSDDKSLAIPPLMVDENHQVCTVLGRQFRVRARMVPARSPRPPTELPGAKWSSS